MANGFVYLLCWPPKLSNQNVIQSPSTIIKQNFLVENQFAITAYPICIKSILGLSCRSGTLLLFEKKYRLIVVDKLDCALSNF